MISRAMRAAQVQSDLFEEVEHDVSLNDEARMLVVLVSLAEGAGVLLSGLASGLIVGGLIGGVLIAILGVARWYLWSYLVLLVGTRFFDGTSNLGEVSRTIAYAYVPNVVRVLGFIPVLGGLLGFIAGIWSLVLGVVAVRQAMDFDTGKAIATVIVAGVIAAVVIAVVGAIVLLPLGIVGSALR